jgi:hypothetical protein
MYRSFAALILIRELWENAEAERAAARWESFRRIASDLQLS